jgi:hypothetical protein
VDTISSLLAGAPYTDMCCPNCNTSGFNPTLVSRSDAVRDYLDSGPPSSGGSSLPLQATASPMKIGDSFEDLKRKMAPAKPQAQSQHTPVVNSTPVVIKSSARMRMLSPEASVDRLVVSALEFDGVATGRVTDKEEYTETRPAQTSARGGGSSREDHARGEEKSAAELETLFSSSGRPLRGIALNAATPTPSDRGSREKVGGDKDNIKSFAAQFVSSIFVSSAPSLAKVRPYDGGGIPSTTLPSQ